MHPTKHMGIIVTLLAAPLLLPSVGLGELAIRLRLEHSETLQFEPIRVTLQITNQGDTPFIVARDSPAMPELSFDILKEGRRTIKRSREGLLLSNLYILPGRTETLSLIVSNWYNLTEMGHYIIGARIEWNDDSYVSNRPVLNVVRGLELARTFVNIPGHKQSLHAGLRHWRRNKQDQLFLVVQDRDGEVSFGVVPLGQFLRVNQPRIEASHGGLLRTVQQVTPDSYLHASFEVSARGVERVEQALMTVDGKPYRRPTSGGRP